MKINHFGEKIFRISATESYFWQAEWWKILLKGVGIIIVYFIFVLVVNRTASELRKLDEESNAEIRERNRKKLWKMK